MQTGLPTQSQAQSSNPSTVQPISTGAAANDTSDNVETSSKRSRRRDASTGSKRSNRQVAGESEKNARPGSAGQAQAGSEPRPKKRGGFLSFLSCCGGSDDTTEPGSRESAQPVKQPTTASQPSKIKSQQQQQVPPNASATNTSADGSKEVIDEKTGHQPNHKDQSTAAPILLTPPVESEKPPPVVAQPDNPVPNIPPGITAVQPNAETSPLQVEKHDLQPEAPVTGPSQIDTTQRNVAHEAQPNHNNANPVVSVIAPTPTVAQQENVAEDALIQDRTPEQAARDTDIEMTDVGPSLPLSTSDVPQSSEVQTTTRERSSSSSSRIDLPPPPPLAERQVHNQHGDAGIIAGAGAGAGILAAGAGVAAHQASEEPSAVSTPEPVQKWLLPPITPEFSGKKCLVLDLDETLVHSSFKVSILVHSSEVSC